MPPLMLIPALALLLGPVPARAQGARQQADDAAVLSQGAADTGDETTTREAAARPFDGSRPEDNTVVAPGVSRRAARLAKPTAGSLQAKVEPPLGVEKKPEGGKLTTGLMLAGA